MKGERWKVVGEGGKYRMVAIVEEESALRGTIHYRGLGSEVKENIFEQIDKLESVVEDISRLSEC